MNCSEGQLAQVVRNVSLSPCRERLIGGTFVTVGRLIGDGVLIGPVWEISSEPVPCPLGGACRLTQFPDADLRPMPPLASDEDQAIDDAARQGEVAHA